MLLLGVFPRSCAFILFVLAGTCPVIVVLTITRGCCPITIHPKGLALWYQKHPDHGPGLFDNKNMCSVFSSLPCRLFS